MRVEYWMTKSAPTIEKGATISEALKVMEDNGLGELAVVDENDRFVGLLNRKDIIELDGEEKAEDHVVLPQFYVHQGDTIESVFLAFMETSEDFVPVVDEDLKVVGMVTLQDVLESMIEITAMDEPGCRISLMLPDIPGELKKIVDTLADNKINILSILTHREDGRRRIVLRVDATNAEDVKKVLEVYGIEYDSIIEEEGF